MNEQANENTAGKSQEDEENGKTAEEKANVISNFIDEFSALIEKHGITNHVLCFQHEYANNKCMLHWGDDYPGAQLIAQGHKILMKKIVDEIS